jgi:hypothetical protein
MLKQNIALAEKEDLEFGDKITPLADTVIVTPILNQTSAQLHASTVSNHKENPIIKLEGVDNTSDDISSFGAKVEIATLAPPSLDSSKDVYNNTSVETTPVVVSEDSISLDLPSEAPDEGSAIDHQSVPQAQKQLSDTEIKAGAIEEVAHPSKDQDLRPTKSAESEISKKYESYDDDGFEVLSDELLEQGAQLDLVSPGLKSKIEVEPSVQNAADSSIIQQVDGEQIEEEIEEDINDVIGQQDEDHLIQIVIDSETPAHRKENLVSPLESVTLKVEESVKGSQSTSQIPSAVKLDESANVSESTSAALELEESRKFSQKPSVVKLDERVDVSISISELSAADLKIEEHLEVSLSISEISDKRKLEERALSEKSAAFEERVDTLTNKILQDELKKAVQGIHM